MAFCEVAVFCRQRLALDLTMKLRHSIVRSELAFKTLAIIAVLALGLLGGLFHHHLSARDSDACAYCHAGAQTPVIDLAGTLVVPFFAVVGMATPSWVSQLPRIVPTSALVPRGPPATPHLAKFWEGCGGLV